ncbi:hypothetical protein [Sphingomonas sp. PvP056]|jgi:hypothetical protein|uniref:hypothetical protein n=1 Tax=Sphingomonas sp. PvP056 TaxID=3156392 RepID=UPI00339A1749
MEPILDEIRATFDCGIWYPVVASVLMLPDACGAVEFWGQAVHSRKRYQRWYDEWVLPHFTSPRVSFDGAVVYIVRNAMIHESTGFTRGEHGFDRVIFTPPDKSGVTAEFCISRNPAGLQETAFIVTIGGLMGAVETGVRNWLADVRSDPDKRRAEALDKLIQARRDGQPPHFVGMATVS